MEIHDILKQIQADEDMLYAKKTVYSPDEYVQFKFFTYYQQDLKSEFPRIYIFINLSPCYTHRNGPHETIVLYYANYFSF